MIQELTLYALEVIRAVDVFLFKVPCHQCGELNLTGIDLKECEHCRASFVGRGIDLSKADHRLLAGSPLVRRKKGLGKKTVLSLLRIQENLCAYCDRNLQDIQYHIDHIVPFSIGGTNNLNNLVIACPECNLLASSKVFNSFMHKRQFVLNERSRLKRFKINNIDDSKEGA